MSSIDVLRKIADFIGHHPLAVTQALVCGLTGQFLVAHTVGGHYDRLVKRAERWLRGGDPVPGFGTFHGRIVPAHVDPGAGPDGGAAALKNPVVERVRTQRHVDKDVWRDVKVSSHGEPFRLDLGGDREIEVIPGEPRIEGFEETETVRPKALREVRSAVYPGESVWVTGYLEPAPKGMGAYRGGGAPRKLRAPRGGRLWITRQAPAEEWRNLARAHRIGGWTALAAFGIAAVVAYPKVLSVWLRLGPAAAPPLPRTIVLVWLVLAVLSLLVWARAVTRARKQWSHRFPWM